MPDSGPFHVSSPLDGCTNGLPAVCAFGHTLNVVLQPREIRILNFSAQPKDWTRLRTLQTRSPETAKAKPKSVPAPVHAVLGAWEYRHGSATYTRTFTPDGICTLRQGSKVEWEKAFIVAGPDRVTVEGGLSHRIKPDGTLDIEGRYTAKKRSP